MNEKKRRKKKRKNEINARIINEGKSKEGQRNGLMDTSYFLQNKEVCMLYPLNLTRLQFVDADLILSGGKT